jgi:hypothetical protein
VSAPSISCITHPVASRSHHRRGAGTWQIHAGSDTPLSQFRSGIRIMVRKFCSLEVGCPMGGSCLRPGARSATTSSKHERPGSVSEPSCKYSSRILDMPASEHTRCYQRPRSTASAATKEKTNERSNRGARVRVGTFPNRLLPSTCTASHILSPLSGWPRRLPSPRPRSARIASSARLLLVLKLSSDKRNTKAAIRARTSE